MFHAAGFPLSGVVFHPGCGEHLKEEPVLLIHSLRYLPAYLSQVEGEIILHGEKSAFPQSRHCVADAGLGYLQLVGYLYGAHSTVFLLEHQDGLQIVLARCVKFHAALLKIPSTWRQPWNTAPAQAAAAQLGPECEILCPNRSIPLYVGNLDEQLVAAEAETGDFVAVESRILVCRCKGYQHRLICGKA